MEDGILMDHAVVMEDSRIGAILPMDLFYGLYGGQDGMLLIDGLDSYIAPGFIDVHSDHLESIIQPRPSSAMDFELAIMEQEKMLVNQGITTMYHSLSFMRQDAAMAKGRKRGSRTGCRSWPG